MEATQFKVKICLAKVCWFSRFKWKNGTKEAGVETAEKVGSTEPGNFKLALEMAPNLAKVCGLDLKQESRSEPNCEVK